MIVENPQNGMKFCEIDAYSLPCITHTNLLQFVVILGAVTPKNSSCGYLIQTDIGTSNKLRLTLSENMLYVKFLLLFSNFEMGTIKSDLGNRYQVS